MWGIFIFFLLFFTHIYFPASGQAVVTGVVPSPPRFLPSVFIGHRVQQFHCPSIFHRVLLTHALALSASQFVLKKKSPRIYTSMHSGGFEPTKLTYTRLEDNLICYRGDRPHWYRYPQAKILREEALDHDQRVQHDRGASPVIVFPGVPQFESSRHVPKIDLEYKNNTATGCKIPWSIVHTNARIVQKNSPFSDDFGYPVIQREPFPPKKGIPLSWYVLWLGTCHDGSSTFLAKASRIEGVPQLWRHPTFVGNPFFLTFFFPPPFEVRWGFDTFSCAFFSPRVFRLFLLMRSLWRSMPACFQGLTRDLFLSFVPRYELLCEQNMCRFACVACGRV